MISAGGDLELATLSGVAKRRSNGAAVGLTAAHALRIFVAGDEVSYFPGGRRTHLGTCTPPPALGPGMDLGPFDADRDELLDVPLGFARMPRLFPESDVASLDGKKLTFLGGQIGEHTGELVRIESPPGGGTILVVKLAAPKLIPGDSGGPLYFDDSTTLFLVGTLVSGDASAPGFSEARFFHPGRALARLDLELNGQVP